MRNVITALETEVVPVRDWPTFRYYVIRKRGIRMPEEIVLEAFKPYIVKHCETAALKRVLDYHGLSLSEEILLGLGRGISFIYTGT